MTCVLALFYSKEFVCTFEDFLSRTTDIAISDFGKVTLGAVWREEGETKDEKFRNNSVAPSLSSQNQWEPENKVALFF